MRINPTYNVIENNTDASSHLPAYCCGRRWLYYIEKTEKKESTSENGGGAGGKGHGDQIAHYLIDDDFRAVLLPQDEFGSSGYPTGQSE